MHPCIIYTDWHKQLALKCMYIFILLKVLQVTVIGYSFVLLFLLIFFLFFGKAGFFFGCFQEAQNSQKWPFQSRKQSNITVRGNVDFWRQNLDLLGVLKMLRIDRSGCCFLLRIGRSGWFIRSYFLGFWFGNVGCAAYVVVLSFIQLIWKEESLWKTHNWRCLIFTWVHSAPGPCYVAVFPNIRRQCSRHLMP